MVPHRPGSGEGWNGAPYRRAWWLPGAHLQTIWGRLARPKRLVDYRREVFLTPDDDDLIVDHVDPPAPRPGVACPHVILLHGLEGSSHSAYAQGLAWQLSQLGFPVSVMNFRGCARDPRRLARVLPNRGGRLYHSGETTDFDFLLKSLAGRHPDRRFAAAGVSLGGNVLLKWLGESAGSGGALDAARLVAAATLSVPYDLAAGARGLERGLGRLYTRVFLQTLLAKVKGLLARHPSLADRVDLPRARAASTFFEFDDAATAPVHGFAGATDYYARCSSLGFLHRIETPALCVSAADDPFLPRTALEAARSAASTSVKFLVTSGGGHAGFVHGSAPWRARYWGEEQLVAWLQTVCR